MKRESFIGLTILVVVFFVMSIILSFHIWITRVQTINDLNTNVSNLSHTLNLYSEGVIRQGEMLIENLSDITEIYGEDKSQITNIKKILAGQDELLEQLNNVVIYDATGNTLIALHERLSGRANSADRFFFVYHQNNTSKKVFIGPPVVSRTNGKWVITISRRLEDHQGRFAGVAVLTLNIENFLETFGKIDIGHSGAIALTSESGILLIRYPFDDKYIGRVISNSPLFTTYLKNSNSGTARSVSRFDNIPRMYAFQKNKRYGLVTTVAVSIDEGMLAWKKQSEILIVIVIFLMGGVITSGYFLLRDIHRRVRTSRELSKTTESLMTANEKLKAMAAEDSLTGLANRRKFDEALPREVLQCAVNKHAISLMLIDIDYFKKYNDNYGHLAGDDCLRQVATSLKKTIKSSSALVARYGGEEFVVILPAIDLIAAEKKAKKIIQSICQENIPHEYSPFGIVTVSIGIASGPGPAVKGKETTLIELADDALYHAKYAGRNGFFSSTHLF
ncbi:GGDEF domain-containing protein [Kosakonia radicincitans]|uniref:sensor domain-containing diguanylate cyclase n=1 Tax=Kosakonia TaxID=1330547 RepID=UPI00090336BE|nr:MULTISPECIES: sensor domain-containing diguanylate cyclase [Kosakonia]APG19368.1 diguanylate cyclase [Kosakonia radicincitans]NCF08062.1 GGDEF domain-containing protein [Kosakonia sp. MH5]PTA88631.1 GGDEF domain-containing protein [Kosakonia sp. H7A]QEM90285.1 GGDEF domain-containing protein [Kosakonia radicincitans]